MVQAVNGIIGPRYEYISYAPLLQDSGDLEAATKTISATTEQAGADYTAAITIPAPPDPRLAVLAIGGQLNVTIDSFGGGGTTLNYRVKRAGVSVSTGTLEAAAGVGAKVVSWETLNPVGLGTPQTYTVYLWVNAGTCVISISRLYVAVGSGAIGTSGLRSCLSITHTGMVMMGGQTSRQGVGNFNAGVRYAAGTLNANAGYDWAWYFQSSAGTGTQLGPVGATPMFSPGALYLAVNNAVTATDLAYYGAVRLVLRTD